MNTNNYVKDIAKNIGVDDKDCIFLFSPNYDPKKGGNHPQKEIYIPSYNCTIPVDEQLVEMLEIINKEDLVTRLSCQYDYLGYAQINFTYQGFRKWTERLFKAYKTKYGHCNTFSPIINRFTFDPYRETCQLAKLKCGVKIPNYNKLTIVSAIWDGQDDHINLSVNWNFLNEDIPAITQQLKELFTENKTYNFNQTDKGYTLGSTSTSSSEAKKASLDRLEKLAKSK